MNPVSARAARLAAAAVLAAGVAAAAPAGPFEVQAGRLPDDPPRVELRFGVPAGHYLYAESIGVSADGRDLTRLLEGPAPTRRHDTFTDGEADVYEQDTRLVYALPVPPPGAVTVTWQGCSPSLCFLPARHTFALNAPAEPAAGAEEAAGGGALPPGFDIRDRAAGYLPAADFLAFLDRAERGGGGEDPLQAALRRGGAGLLILLVLAGGLALNLTPCVLPMIPVNIAIIGAGAQAGSRARGFVLGGLYGLGIALVYGVLGLVVILTRAPFGQLNASPWFNLGVAGVFALLALGMFDIIRIDFSRFQAGAEGGRRGRGPYLTALFFGGVAALLAGACVAPVVISVLLLASSLFTNGQPVGLALPFLLGIGMALPWPLAGAGLSVLPRPGRWMNRVKIAFGILILLFAAWYGRLGVRLLLDRQQPAPAVAAADTGHAGWLTWLDDALQQAAREGRPVFIDFWATWCKNCLHMDATTFKDPEVRRRLERYVRVKVQAENPSDPETGAMLERFGALGLPTYVVLAPRATAAGGDGAP